MKMTTIKCPECGAKIPESVKAGKTLFCSYCGHQIYVDDEVKRSEHRIVNVSVNETKIRKAELKAQKEKRDNRVGIFCLIGMFLIVGTIIGLGLWQTNKSENEEREHVENGDIRVESSGSYEGENYEVVVKILRDKGFTNIETIDLDDSSLFKKKGNIDTISIGGKTYFMDGSWFPKDSKVIISYH